MDTIRKKLHKGLGRVDVQAALLAVALTICSSVFIYGFYYKTTYNEMIKTLEMRTESIHQYLEQVLTKVLLQLQLMLQPLQVWLLLTHLLLSLH